MGIGTLRRYYEQITDAEKKRENQESSNKTEQTKVQAQTQQKRKGKV